MCISDEICTSVCDAEVLERAVLIVLHKLCVHSTQEQRKRETAEGKNDNNDNTEPNGMKSESEKIMVSTSLLCRSSLIQNKVRS